MKNNYGIKILKYFKSVKLSLIILLILMVLFCLIDIINPIITANLLTSITDLKVEYAIMLSLVLIIVSVIKAIVNYVFNYIYLKKIKNEVIFNIRKDMIKKIFDLKIVNFDKHTSGEFINRLKNDPSQISTILSVVQFSFLSLITDLLILGYILYVNYIIGIIYIISVFVIYIYQKNALGKVKKIREETKKIGDKNISILNEILRGIRDIKILNITSKTHDMVIESLNDTTNIETERTIKSSVIAQKVDIMQTVTVFLIISVGMILVNKNLITVTNLILIYMYRTNVFDLSLCYRSIKDQLIEYSISAKRIFEIMDNEIFPKEKFGVKKIDGIKGKIEFKDLSFSYGKKKVLDNISFTINPNDTIGIVGESGSGKTTLLNLLSKSYDVDDNKIFIDDIDINELSRNSIRDNIAVISQYPYIFNLTIKENLKLIGHKVKDEDIIEACKIAQIHDYIMSLPNQYETLLGEGGTTLSGGQKQRLAIARALIKKSKIILFDEATSSLDNVTQTKVQQAINNISKDYTVIIVAHRLSTIKDCNKIYVLENGKIVGVGNHEELLNHNECYRRLYSEELNYKV